MRYSLPHEKFDINHPLISQEYAVYTPMIDEMALTVGNWIDELRPGGYIYGASRFGKSKGVNWFLNQILKERFGVTLPLVIWSRRETQYSESEFWHELLIAAEFEFVDHSKRPRKSEGFHLFVMRLISLAKVALRNHVILVIDEAQGLTFKEWLWLVGLYNALDKKNTRLTLISIGSHQMGYKHELMSVSGNAHVAARFMSCHAKFHGIRSQDELTYVLLGYDEASEWPAGSGTSYFAYFAPEHFRSGKRLSSCAEVIWAVLTELRPDNVKKRNLEYPMQHICWAIESAIFRLALGANWSDVMSYGTWMSELKKVELPLHLKIISNHG